MQEVTDKQKSDLKDIISMIKNGKVTLFMGAGCSLVSSAPSTEKLIALIEQKFPKVGKGHTNLFQVCEKVIRTRPYTLTDLQDFIDETFETLRPSDYHKRLTNYDWSGIFTTNYDDLIETAYKEPDRGRRAIVLYGNEDRFHFSERDKTHVFKLMGTIGKQDPLTEPVLTFPQYISSFKNKARFYDLLLDVVKDGMVVFIGYSFDDEIAFQVYETALSNIRRDRFPTSYFIAPHDEPIDSVLMNKFEDFKITPLNMKFEDFMEYIENNYGVVSGSVKNESQKDHHYLKLNRLQEPLKMSDGLLREVELFGDLLTPDKLDSDSGDKDLFFKGKNYNWGAFKSNWDFKRDLYSEIKMKVDADLARTNPEENKFLLILGNPGSGKSVLLKRLAYDIANEGRSVVFYVDPHSGEIDLKPLDSLLNDIDKKYSTALEGKGANIERLKFTIIIDDAGTSQINPNMIKNHMTSRGTPCLIIGASRESEWQWSVADNPFEMSERNIFKLKDQPDSSEMKRLLDHVVGLGYPGSASMSLIGDTDEDRSFFGILFTYIYPTRPPLSRIIRDQLQNLEGYERNAFINICLFSQFNLSLNQELLIRSLDIGYVEFYNKVYTQKIEELTIEKEDFFGNKFYGALHRIIASMAIRHYLRSDEDLFQSYKSILKVAKLDIDAERMLISSLFVDFLGAKKKFTNFTLEQKESLFETVCNGYRSKTLLHHFGIVKHQLRKYEEAETLLNSALSISTSRAGTARYESNRNILVSLGTLYSDWAMDLLDSGNEDDGAKYLALAERNFENARFNGPPNAYPYHAQANMYIALSQRKPDQTDRMMIYGKALSVISLSEANLDKEDLEPIYDLKSKIYRNMGDEENTLLVARKLANDYGSSMGFIGYIVYLIDRFDKEHNFAIKQPIAYNILCAVAEGLKLIPKDEGLLRLNAKVATMLFPTDFQKKISELRKWYDNATKYDLDLMFQLSVLLFETSDFHESFKVFDKLSKISQGLARRFASREFYRDERGEKQIFEGEVINIDNDYNGQLMIYPSKISIYFRPIATPFTPDEGDIVKFHISFSYRGPKADIIERG